MYWNIFRVNPSVPVVAPGDKPPRVKVYLAREYLDRFGYDSRGRYWGVAEPLYYYDVGDTRGGFIDKWSRKRTHTRRSKTTCQGKIARLRRPIYQVTHGQTSRTS